MRYHYAMSKRTITCSVLAAIAVGAGTFIHFSNEPVAEAPVTATTTESNIAIIEEANPVVPGDFSYPNEPTATTTELLPPSETIVEPILPPPIPREDPPVTKGQCRPGGCSGQLCTDEPDLVTTCEWREEYACYQNATCERQPSGECGWTQSPELKQCLSGTVSASLAI